MVVKMARRLLFVTACCLLAGHSSPRELYEGSKCRNSDSSSGICKAVTSCPEAMVGIRSQGKHNLKRCGFDRFTEIVCCPSGSRNVNPPDTDTASRTVIRKSEKACETYSKQAPIALTYHIVGGENADLGEFPHMAALGFYSEADSVYRFDCGGTLISERYILTAAHCILNIERNDLKFCRLGVVNISTTVEGPDPDLDYDVENITIHKEYKWKEKFNDIALVKLTKEVTFNNFVRPACLYGKSDDPEKLIVTGWGANKLGGDRVNILQKANLRAVPLSECNVTYLARTKRNIIKSQICAADERSDACQGDSGGPLQIQTNNSLVTVVGITSYGIGCGSKYPGIYTRINSYLDWIEETVWP